MSYQNTVPEVRNIKQMLQYQENSIVSRMVVKNNAGNVTIFAFDGSEGLSEHTAPFEALVIGIEGHAEITIEGSSYMVDEGDSLLLPANVPHSVHPIGRFKMILTMLRGEA